MSEAGHRDVRIRRARAADAGRVRELRLRALESDPDAFGETYERASTRPEADYVEWISKPENAMFLAVTDDDSLVGMAVGAPAPVEDRPRPAALYAMWVAPEARGRGVGGALLDAVEGWARAGG